MRSFLLDTNILSELALHQPAVTSDLARWLVAEAENLHVSVVSLIEVEAGIAKLRRGGSAWRADRLSAWLDRLSTDYGQRLIGVDGVLARRIGELSDHAKAMGRHPGLADIAIAATARERRLTLLTRNVRHFEPLGMVVLDPFEALP